MDHHQWLVVVGFVTLSYLSISVYGQDPSPGGPTTELTTYPYTLVVSSIVYKQFKPAETELPMFSGTIPNEGTVQGWFHVSDWTVEPEVQWVTYPNGKRGKNGSPWWRRTIRRNFTKIRAYYRHYQTQEVSHRWSLTIKVVLILIGKHYLNHRKYTIRNSNNKHKRRLPQVALDHRPLLFLDSYRPCLIIFLINMLTINMVK